MLFLARLGFGRGRIHWYDLVFFALAAAMVYPDEVLDWIGSWSGKHFTWVHVVVVELMAGGTLAMFVVWLLPQYPSLHWWTPLLIIGMLVLFRGIWFAIERSFGD